MQYLDISAEVHPSMMAPRSMSRRGIVLHEQHSGVGLESLVHHRADVRKPRSYDYYVSRVGEIYQLTIPGYHAYHSGTARWRLYQESDYTINQGFYGIAVEYDAAPSSAWTGDQYRSVAWLIRALVSTRTIALVDVIGHYQCALPVGRIKSPVGLNWATLTSEVINPTCSSNELYPGVVLP